MKAWYRAASALPLAGAVVWLMGASCGGRALGDPHADGGGAGQIAATAGDTGAAGATGAAGSTSAAGTTGGAGTTAAGGATGAAGATAAGGATGTAGVPGLGGAGGGTCELCPPVQCKPGFVPQKSATSCCLVCRPLDCSAVSCAMPQCADGSHLETPPSQCCPVCTPGKLSMACENGMTSYMSFRQQIVEKYSSAGCKTDMDCTIVDESNRCHHGCGIAVAVSLAQSLDSGLNGTGDTACASCPDDNITPPCAALVPLCSNGQCASGSPR